MSSEELYVDSSENDEDEDWELSEYIDSVSSASDEDGVTSGS